MSHTNKREREDDVTPQGKKSTHEEEEEELVFEDPFEDDYEEEEMMMAPEEEDEEEEHEEGEEQHKRENDETQGEQNREKEILVVKKVDLNLEGDHEEEENDEKNKIWDPKTDPLEPGEKLEYDNTAYDMIHFVGVEWPCLSFDIITDNLGYLRNKFPHTIYMVSGTQAGSDDKNNILLMKLSDLHSTKHDDDSDEGFDLDEPSDLDDDPILENRSIKHPFGSINRIRSMPQQPNIISCFSSNKEVQIYDFKNQLLALDKPPSGILREPSPIHTFKGHPTEGWALSWSPKNIGRMASGDCNGYIYLWEPDNANWQIDKVPYVGHRGSVEDICWSPSEGDVFSSCGVDGMIQIWDTRTGKTSVTGFKAHETDVNVMGWNHKRAFLLLSGADDGTFKVWDLRKLNPSMTHQFSFSWHNGPITSVEWNPNDDSELAVSSADNSITIWDLSLTIEKTKVDGLEVPSQLLFVHQGQTDIKEVHWHKQIPGVLVSTASDGFNVFKPSNVGQ